MKKVHKYIGRRAKSKRQLVQINEQGKKHCMNMNRDNLCVKVDEIMQRHIDIIVLLSLSTCPLFEEGEGATSGSGGGWLLILRLVI